jgi:Tfp pilus assembly protein PilN
MSIRVNLLPDVRLAKMRDQRTRHMVAGISILVWAVTGLVVGGMGILYAAEKVQLANLNKAIAADKAELASISGLNSALTAQQATKNLGSLYDSRTYFSAFMPLLMSRLPLEVSIQSVQQNESGTLTISGVAKSIQAANKFTDSLKVASPKILFPNDETASDLPYFTAVEVNQFAKDDGGRASFSLTATVSPEAFHGQK